MAKGIGRLQSVGIAKETTRGTAVGSAAYWLPFSEASLEEKFDNVTQDESFAVIEDSIGQFRVKNWVEGTVKVPLTDQSLPLVLFGVFGANADAAHGAEAAVYDHKATVGESAQHQSLSFFINDALTATDYVYANGVVHKAEIDIELKKFAEINLSVKALKGVVQAASPSMVAENRFLPQYMTFQMAPLTTGVKTATTCTGTASSTVHVTALSISTDLLEVGMTVSGTNIPSGTTISSIVSNTAFDMSQASTGTVATIYIGSLNTYTATGTSTIHVTALPAAFTAKLQVGMTVMGTNVPAGATIVSIVSTTAFDLSASTSGALSNLTFGGAVVKLKSLKLTIDESIEDDDVLGSTAPNDFLNKQFKMEGQLTALWQNESDFKTIALAAPNVATSLLIDIKNTDVTIGTACNPEVKILLDQVYFTEFSRPFKVNDLVMQTVKFRCTYSLTNSEMAKTTVTNTVASY